MNNDKLNSNFQWINIVIFFVIIFTPGVSMLLGSKEIFSFTEKRPLATFPVVPDSPTGLQDFFSGLDDYLDDHFGLREWMVYRYQREMRKRFPDVERMSKVMQGLDNWDFYTENHMLEDFTGKFLRSDNELKEWLAIYREKKKWFEELGIPYLLIVPPNKMTIYGEFLGEPWVGKRGKSRLMQLGEAMKDSDKATFVDLSPALIAENHRDYLFFRSDTHWTFYGAYLGYLTIADRVEPLLKTEHFKRDFTLSEPLTRVCDDKEDECGDLTSMLLEYETFSERYRTVDLSSPCNQRLPVDIELSNLDYSNKEHSFRTVCGGKKLRALVFRDSFFGDLIPYFSENFKEVIYLWKDYDQNNVEEVLQIFKPDIVIEEKAERAL